MTSSKETNSKRTAAAAAASQSEDDVKVLGFWVSPFVLRTRFALNLKGVEHQILEENLAAKSDLLLESNPVYKKIPVLIHNGRPVCESMIIVQYIDDVWTSPPGATAPLLPAGPYERATHRFWAYYVDDKWFPALLKALIKSQVEDERKEAMEQIVAGLKLLEEAMAVCSKGKAFFNGDDIGYLDISVGCCLAMLRAVERMGGRKLIDAERTPLLAGWAERFSAHAAVKGVLPETDRLVEFAVTFFPSLKSPPAGN